MKKQYFSAGVALLAWFAVVAQYVLMMENRTVSIPEATIRFFSFFTILTNTLVAVYLTMNCFRKKPKKSRRFQRPGILTAITVYITVVGLVYQVVLRQTWHPTGLQRIVDEMLHTIIPVLFILFWFLYENKARVKWGQIPAWLIYPLVYVIYILARGSASGFYPYPFVDVVEIGYKQVLINCLGLFVVFGTIAAIFVGMGGLLENRRGLKFRRL